MEGTHATRDLVGGKYRIVRSIGRGGMGEVFLANQVNLDRLVVVKRLLPNAKPDAVRALLGEARVAARLHHPNIVSVLDVSRDGEPPYVAMEYLPGVSLRELLERTPVGQVPPRLALHIALDVARGLAHAQGARGSGGVVHRDVKPRNIMVTFAGVAKLIDFGISRWLGDDDIAEVTSISGTRGYMAPEQLAGRRIDGRVDQFALGVTLREMLTGERPLEPDHATRLHRGPAAAPPPAIDAAIAAVIDRATAEDPAARFATCADLGAAIEAAARDTGMVASAAELGRHVGAVFPDELAAADREVAGGRGDDPTRADRPGAGRAPAATSADARPLSNLDDDRTAFVGREDELARLAARIGGGSPLITLIGPPGIGKTRLARELARRHTGAFPGGTWFADVTEARSPEGVLVGIAGALAIGSLDASFDASVRQLGAAIAHRGHVLMIVDNFEQVVKHAAATLGRLSALAPDARWLVTSRESLNLPGEVPIEVGPLPTHRDSASYQLLLDRARAVRPDLAPTAEDIAELAAVVDRLEGNPLAIELAAGRLKLLSPRQLRERLAAGFTVLSGRRRGVPERQTAFDKAIEWSWQMLEPWEQAALAQAGVFRGGFGLDGAEAVIELDDARAPDLLDVIESLCDKSLLRRVSAPEIPDEARFTMYEGIREFAFARLEAAGTVAAARARHAAHYLAYAESWSAQEQVPQVFERSARLVVEVENVWAIVEPAIADGARPGPGGVIALRALLALFPIRERRGLRLAFARALDVIVDGGLADGAPPEVQTAALRARGDQAIARTPQIAYAHSRAAAELARHHGLEDQLAMCLQNLVRMAHRCGEDTAVLRGYAAEAVARFPGEANRERRAVALSTAVGVEAVIGLSDEDVAQFEADLEATARATDRPAVQFAVHWALSGHYTDRGKLDAAVRHLLRAVELLERLGDSQTVLAVARSNLAELYTELGQLDRALALLERSYREVAELGLRDVAGAFPLVSVRESLGDLDGAAAACRDALDAMTRPGEHATGWMFRADAGRAVLAAELASLEAQAGRHDAAAIALDLATRYAASCPSEGRLAPEIDGALAILSCARGQVALADNAVETAREHLAAALARDAGASWSAEYRHCLARLKARLATA